MLLLSWKRNFHVVESLTNFAMTDTQQTFFILSIAGIATAVLFSLPAIPQDSNYHRFAAGPSILGTVHFWNLASNLGFVIVGYVGLRHLVVNPTAWSKSWKAIFTVFFAGVLLTGIGSMYYHWNPDNLSLVFDRLPMSVAFAAFFCLVIGVVRSADVAARLLIPFAVFSLASVLYWYGSELRGSGDLRPYVLTQFLPIILIPFLIITSKIKSSTTWDISAVLIAYAISKVFEFYDQEIFDWTGIIGGHPLKHLIAAVGTAFIIKAMHRPGIANVDQPIDAGTLGQESSPSHTSGVRP